MTRREFFSTVSAGAVPSISRGPLIVPVHIVMDGPARLRPQQIREFRSRMWPEAVRDFERCGIRFESSVIAGEVRRSAGGGPVFTGLDRSVINLVITDQIPMKWDKGVGLCGATTRFQGYHVCMVALNYAHCHQVPLLSVNTCVHELLHALLGDIFDSRPKGLFGETREFRIDYHATRLWLFRDGADIRQAAQAYVERLRREAASQN